MSGSTQGERKLSSPAENAIASPKVAESSIPDVDEDSRVPSRRDRLLRWYHAVKYHAFRRERRPLDGRRGLVVLQIDALAYSDLRRALDLGYCPTLTHLLRRHDFMIRRWFCGLPSATPYCQAGFFHGENDGIPAFRFYDKAARIVITCNAPHGVQYIRDRIRSPGALAGGSSYVNLLDGDAQTVGFTVATRERMSVWQRLGGRRMLLLMFLHPIRVARMGVQAIWEWLREEWERTLGEWSRRATHAEGVFPFVRILTNVVVRELQTMAVMLDVWLGVPVIYTTFMQYDELSHHFGPSSPQALKDLRRTDARIREIWRMIRAAGGREYDLVILSDHGSTPSISYRVRFGESLGTTIHRRLDEAAEGGRVPLKALASFAEDTEFADLAPHVVQTVAAAARPRHRRIRWMLRRAARWIRSRYGLRELLFPEKYLVSTRHEVVVTYSSCLAHVYFADTTEQLERQHLAADRRRAYLYAALLENAGIGLLLTRAGPAVYMQSRDGRAVLEEGEVRVLAGANPLEPYGSEPYLLRAVERLVRQANAGDIVVFGAWDGYEIVSFDDQVGAHGSAGGDQVYPFIMAPASLGLADAALEDARDVHRELLSKYSERYAGDR